MTTKMIRQTRFSTGQVDTVTWKRTDIKAYLSAAQLLLNCEVGTTALVKKRKGSQYLLKTNTWTDTNSQLYEFSDKNSVYYIIMGSPTAFAVFKIDPIDGHLTHYTDVSGTPYSSGELPQIDYTLDNDVLLLTHPAHAPARIYISDYTTTPYTFTYQVLAISPYPSYDFGNINYSGFTAAFTYPSATTFQLVLTGTGAGAFTTAWVGGVIIGFGPGDLQPLGYGIITTVTPGVGTTTFVGNISSAFAIAANMPTSGSQYSVRQPVFSATLGWPSKVLFYQNRLWFGNTSALNNTIFGSRLNSPLNFDVGTGLDTDAIVYTIGQTNSGGIVALNGGKQLEIYTTNYEFAAPQEQNVGLTPGTFSIRQQSSNGSSTVCKPLTYLNDSYYITSSGNAIINFHFDGIGQTYTSSNVSVASSALVKAPINRALLRGTPGSQDNFIYYLNPDNTLTAFQFANEANLAALTPIDFNTFTNHAAPNLVVIKDIVSVNNQVYLLKYYTLTGVYGLEVFEETIKMDGFQNLSIGMGGVVTGLTDFNGYTVQVVYSGQDYGSYLVSGGQITITNPPTSGTVQVGLLYDVQITPMYLFVDPIAADYFKKISAIYVDYYNSLNFFINGELVNYQSFAAIQAEQPLTPQTGTAIKYPVNGWNRDATFLIEQTAPFDLQITSIGYQITADLI